MINRDNLNLQSSIEECLRLHAPSAPANVQAIFRQSRMAYAQDIGRICNSRPEIKQLLKEQVSANNIKTVAVAVSEFIDAVIDAYKIKVLRIGTDREPSTVAVAAVASQGTKSALKENDLTSWMISKCLEPNEYTSLSQAGISTLSSLLSLHEVQLRSLNIKKVPLLKLKKAIDEENGIIVQPSLQPPVSAFVAPPAPSLTRGVSGDINNFDDSFADPLTMSEAHASIDLLRQQRELENIFLTRINSIVLEQRSRFTSKALEVLMCSKADHQDRAKRLAVLITDKISRDDIGRDRAFRVDLSLSRFRGVRFTASTRKIESCFVDVGYTTAAAAAPRAPSRGKCRPSVSKSSEQTSVSSSSSAMMEGVAASDLGLAHLRLKESRRLEEEEESKRNLEAFQLQNGEKWKCSTCTTMNDRHRTICGTCNTNRRSTDGRSLEVNQIGRPSSSSSSAAGGRPVSAAGGSMAGILGGSCDSGWENKDVYSKPPPVSPFYSEPTESSNARNRDVARPPPAAHPAPLFNNRNSLKIWSCNCGKLNKTVDIYCKVCGNKRR